MNRFSQQKKWKIRSGLFLAPLFAVLILVFFILVFQEMGRDTGQKELEHLEQVLEQSVVTCYALEGTYPESLQYLKDHYGISWDQDRYLVDFEIVGRNLPPDITVIDKMADAG